jgi:hypothetical protein
MSPPQRTASPIHFFRPFYRGFLRHPVLVLVAVLFLAIAWNSRWVIRDYGLSALFWHELCWTEFLNGVAVTLLLGKVCFVAYLRDMESDWLNKEEAAPPPGDWSQRFVSFFVPDPSWKGDYAEQWELEAPYWAKLRWYLLVTWVPLLVAVLIPAACDPAGRWTLALGTAVALFLVTRYTVKAFNRIRTPAACVEQAGSKTGHKRPGVDALHPAVSWAFATLFVCFALIFVFFQIGWKGACFVLILLALLLVVLLAAMGVIGSFVSFRRLPEAERWRHSVAAMTFGLVFLIYVGTAALSLWPRAEFVLMRYVTPPVVGLCLVISMAVVVDNTVRFHFPRAYVLCWIALLGLGVLANSYQERRLHFPGMSYDNIVTPVAQDPLVENGNPDVQARLRRQYDAFLTQLDAGKRGAWEQAHPEADLKQPKNLLDARDELVRKLEDGEQAKLAAWEKGLTSPAGSKPKLVVVAVVGGANRAALWTAVVLTELEEDKDLPNFARHVRVVTGASAAWSAPATTSRL